METVGTIDKLCKSHIAMAKETWNADLGLKFEQLPKFVFLSRDHCFNAMSTFPIW
jgi:hypothetical protein